MSSKLFSQIVLGLATSIGGNVLYSGGVHAVGYVAENYFTKPEEIEGLVEAGSDLQERMERLEELADQSEEDDPKKSFELAVMGLSDFFGEEDIERASITLMLAIIKNENCGVDWEKYGKKSRIFLTSYSSETYEVSADLPSVCGPLATP